MIHKRHAAELSIARAVILRLGEHGTLPDCNRDLRRHGFTIKPSEFMRIYLAYWPEMSVFHNPLTKNTKKRRTYMRGSLGRRAMK